MHEQVRAVRYMGKLKLVSQSCQIRMKKHITHSCQAFIFTLLTKTMQHKEIYRVRSINAYSMSKITNAVAPLADGICDRFM